MDRDGAPIDQDSHETLNKILNNDILTSSRTKIVEDILEQLANGTYPEDHSKAPRLLRVIWILLAVSACFIVARLWAKLRITRRIYYDDALMILSWVCGLLHASFVTVAAQNGLGRHLLHLHWTEMDSTMYWSVVAVGWGWISPTFGRIAVLITMLFLTGTDPRTSKWPVLAFIALQSIVNSATIILFYTQCGTELDVFWSSQPALIFERCLDLRIQTDFGYFAGSFNVLTDAYLTLLPAILITHSRLTKRQKITLALMLCLSVLALVAAIVKTYEAKLLSSIIDYSYDLNTYTIWLAVELNVVIISGCVPFLRPLFSRPTAPTWEPEPPSQKRWENISMGTMLSKGGRTTSSRISAESEENMVDKPGRDGGQGTQSDRAGIVVTTEVQVSYAPTDAPFVHASMVGLVPGNVARANSARG